MSHASAIPPQPGAENLHKHWKADILSGFLVFLIAMPLCLAIARASNYPPIAGIWTAVIGGVICTLLSNSQMTIKGPAAGLIVIAAGAVVDFGKEFYPALPAAQVEEYKAAGKSDEDIQKELEGRQMFAGYKLALGIGVVAGLIQIFFGLLRAGKLGDFFPLSAVHGLLASIGIIIIAKQAYLVLGVDPPKGADPLELIAHLPGSIESLNPEIAAIGLVSLLILFGLPWIPIKAIRRIPGPMLVIMVAIPLGMAFHLEHRHSYLFPDHFFDTEHYTEYVVGPRFLVDMPEVLANPGEAFAVPDFRGVLTMTGLQYLVLFALIGSLESLLSAKAVDLIDPYRRKTNFDRDLTAVGFANTISAAVGGLPMISEIVRSKANIDNGARTRWSNFFHGIFLLAFVLLLPNLIHRIPLAALGAMLVYTGFRLASPHEFVRTYKVGLAQLVIFLTTVVVTLATDLLLGIFSGVAVKFLLQWLAGVEFRYTFRPAITIERPEGSPVRIRVQSAAVFSNWLSLKKSIQKEGENGDVTLDLFDSCLIDHSVMEKLHELERDFTLGGRTLKVVGLDEHRPVSRHPKAARKKPLVRGRKLEEVES